MKEKCTAIVIFLMVQIQHTNRSTALIKHKGILPIQSSVAILHESSVNQFNIWNEKEDAESLLESF